MFTSPAALIILFSTIVFASTSTSKIDELWTQYSQTNDSIEKVFKHIRMSSGSKSPIRKYIDDKGNHDKIRQLISEGWKKEMQKQFSEKEISYFIALYSHPVFKKAVTFNDQFWSKDVYKYMELPPDAASNPTPVKVAPQADQKK